MKQSFYQFQQYQLRIQDNKWLPQTRSSKIYECCKVQGHRQKLIAKIVQDKNSILQQREKVITEILKKQNTQNIHIVKMLDQFFYEPNKEWIQIQEYSQSSLQSRIDQLSSFKEDEALDVIAQILKGYQFLYDKNIIHRDLKPDNILSDYVEGHYLYKICDFGVSKIIDSQQTIITLTGTPIYTSPEMSLSQSDNYKLHQDQVLLKLYCDKPDHLIDIFSLGIILYRLVCGNFPFEKSIQDIIMFYSNLEQNKLVIPVENNISYETQQMILSMLKYYPTSRITFPELMENALIKKHLLLLETKFKNLYNCQNQIENNQQLKPQKQLQFQQEPKSLEYQQQSQITLESSQSQQSQITLELSQQQQSQITLESSSQKQSQITLESSSQKQSQIKLNPEQQSQLLQQQLFQINIKQVQQQSFFPPLQSSNPQNHQQLRSFNPQLQCFNKQKSPPIQQQFQMPTIINSNKNISQKQELNQDIIKKSPQLNSSFQIPSFLHNQKSSMNQQINQQADNHSTIKIDIKKHEENYSNDDWVQLKNYLIQNKNCPKLMDEDREQINYIINQQQPTQQCFNYLKNIYPKIKEHQEKISQIVDKLLQNRHNIVLATQKLV